MPQQLHSTHTVIPRALIVYQRERSSVWQCRIKVGGRWVRRSTKELKLADAIERARELMVEAEIRRREGLPVVTKRFRDVAQLANHHTLSHQTRSVKIQITPSGGD